MKVTGRVFSLPFASFSVATQQGNFSCSAHFFYIWDKGSSSPWASGAEGALYVWFPPVLVVSAWHDIKNWAPGCFVQLFLALEGTKMTRLAHLSSCSLTIEAELAEAGITCHSILSEILWIFNEDFNVLSSRKQFLCSHIKHVVMSSV